MKVFIFQDTYYWIPGKTFVVIALFIIDIHVFMYIYKPYLYLVATRNLKLFKTVIDKFNLITFKLLM